MSQAHMDVNGLWSSIPQLESNYHASLFASSSWRATTPEALDGHNFPWSKRRSRKRRLHKAWRSAIHHLGGNSFNMLKHHTEPVPNTSLHARPSSSFPKVTTVKPSSSDWDSESELVGVLLLLLLLPEAQSTPLLPPSRQ